MVMAIDKNGNERSFTLDIDRIIAMEEADPKFSFMECVQELGDKLRISTLNKVCLAIGMSLKEMLALGFTVEKIADIFTECMRDAGFISAKPDSEPSSTE